MSALEAAALEAAATAAMAAMELYACRLCLRGGPSGAVISSVSTTISSRRLCLPTVPPRRSSARTLYARRNILGPASGPRTSSAALLHLPATW